MRTISDKQVATIKSLIAERVLDESNTARVETLRDYYRNGLPVPSSVASYVIGELLKAPREVTAPAAQPALGAYRLADGRIVRIVDNREKTRRYGKVWDDDAATWLYLRGLGRLVSGLTPLTLDEAEAFGVATGQCAICGRTLTKAESIARGIGPVCAGKF